jgi:chorismate synthase
MGDSFGRIFRLTSFGESHGEALGGVVEGCPPGIELDQLAVQAELDRRRPGQSKLVTPRKESDTLNILSGVLDGKTLGTAIGLLFQNTDVDSSKYDDLKGLYRPSHADYTYQAKYGQRDWRGGGRASARETVVRVAAGAIARQIISSRHPDFEVVAWVDRVADVEAVVDSDTVTRQQVDEHLTRCPDPSAAIAMQEKIEATRKAKDTVGGVVACVARGVPAGWGVPVFDKLDGDLARAMLSIPACKGFESGSGFAGTTMNGSSHNDPFVMKDGHVRTRTNHSGGIQGGISNGEPVLMRLAFKPVATIFQKQDTVTTDGQEVQFAARGRHDPCVLPRAVPIVEAMTCLVLCDHMLRQAALHP